MFHWNYPLLSAIFSLLVAQILKVPLEGVKARRWDWRLVFESGGMPSSHSAMVTATAVSMVLDYGWDSPWFTISVVFALVVMYDAAGVRRQAGEHAVVIHELLNLIQSKGVATESIEATKLPRWYRKGHTPFEVLGGIIVGVCIAVIVHMV